MSSDRVGPAIPPSAFADVLPSDCAPSTRSTGSGLRVVFVNDISFIVETLIPELERLGVMPRLVGRKPTDPSSHRGSYPRAMIRTWSQLRIFSPYDILHINYGLFGSLAFGEAAPTVLHFHGSDIRPAESAKNRLAHMVSRLSVHLVDRVWYSTTDLAPFFKGLKVPHRYMPNPVSTTFLSVDGKPPETPEVLFAVPLSSQKGAEVGIEAMRLLLEKHPGIHVSAFGFGPDPAKAAALRRRISRSLRLLSWTPHSDMPSVFSRASAVVGQLGGVFGVTELEAMGSARPVITSGSGRLTKVESYYAENPPLVSCRSPEEVVDAILNLIDDKDSAMELGARGRDWVQRYHSSAVVAALYLREYRSLLETVRVRI